jgi:hypothetical protein
LNAVYEFGRECLLISVKRKFNSADVIDGDIASKSV